MPDRLVTELLAAIDRGHEIRLRRPAVPVPGLDVIEADIVEELPDGRSLHHRTVVTRTELVDGVGAYALAYAIECGSRSIEETPRP